MNPLIYFKPACKRCNHFCESIKFAKSFFFKKKLSPPGMNYGYWTTAECRSADPSEVGSWRCCATRGMAEEPRTRYHCCCSTSEPDNIIVARLLFLGLQIGSPGQIVVASKLTVRSITRSCRSVCSGADAGTR